MAARNGSGYSLVDLSDSQRVVEQPAPTSSSTGD